MEKITECSFLVSEPFTYEMMLGEVGVTFTLYPSYEVTTMPAGYPDPKNPMQEAEEELCSLCNINVTKVEYACEPKRSMSLRCAEILLNTVMLVLPEFSDEMQEHIEKDRKNTLELLAAAAEPDGYYQHFDPSC